MRHMKLLLSALAMHALALCSGNALGIGDFKPTKTELMLLPAYCAPRAEPYGNQNEHPEVAPWVGMFGPDWIHMHHYCAALLWQKKASLSLADKKRRDGMLQTALSEIAYVERAVSPTFVFRGEMATVKGDALAQLNQPQIALLAYRQAIESDPAYANAYVRLGALQAKMGEREAALATVTQGLQLTAGSKALKRAYDEYGGKPPYPAPLAKEARSETKETESTVAPAVPATEPAPMPDPNANATKPLEPEPAAIGSPTNPYCRFCTD